MKIFNTQHQLNTIFTKKTPKLINNVPILKIGKVSSCIHFSEAVAEPQVCSNLSHHISPHLSRSSEISSSIRIQTPPRNVKLSLPAPSSQNTTLGGSMGTGKVEVGQRPHSLFGSFVQESETQKEHLETRDVSFCFRWEPVLQFQVVLFPVSNRFTMITSFWVIKSWPDSLANQFRSSWELRTTRATTLSVNTTLWTLCWRRAGKTNEEGQ